MRALRRLAVLGAMSLGGLGAGPATAATVPVDSTFTDPGNLTRIDNVSCGLNQPGLCEIEARGHSRLTGTLSGWTDYTGWVHGSPDGSQSYHSRETFTGTVKGCGRGTFGFVVEDGYISGSPSEADPLGRDERATWTFVPGSGTGDLSNLVAGAGQEKDVIIYPDTSAKGRFVGSLTCQTDEPAARRSHRHRAHGHRRHRAHRHHRPDRR